jgi:hypothetical protein
MNIDSELIFTRYLYIKDEVKYALLVSILQQKEEEAIFWGYELYHSGYKHEFFTFMWKIYYDFFASLNPLVESYFLKIYTEFINNPNTINNDIFVSILIQNVIIQPYNIDMFMLSTVCSLFVIECETIINITEAKNILSTWIYAQDLRSIGQWILYENNNRIDTIDIYKLCLDIFEEMGLKLTKKRLLKEYIVLLTAKIDIHINIIVLSKIIYLFSKHANIIKGKNKNIYIMVDTAEIQQYNTIIGQHYTILKKACIYGIDDLKHLSLFKLQRNKYDISQKYWYHWEYHASFSPLWFTRITEFGGKVDYIAKKVIFQEEPNDDELQSFYNTFGYEPDEQLTNVQEKSIMPIEKKYDWKWFYNTYKKNGLFEVYEEELDELNVDGIEY